MNKKITVNLLPGLLLRSVLASLLLCFINPASANILHESLKELRAEIITGTITDDTGAPMPGVSVFEKNNRQHGTTSDANGKYSIQVERGAILVFASIGYEQQEVTIASNNIVNISLVPQSTMLNEVVAIGYQTLRKSDVTGAISSVKAGELNLSAPTLSQALVGKVAGVQIAQTSGAPYQGTKIRVRGIGSFSASSDPLYVIDGYPASNDIFLNPNDIESVDILKDAASAAIYGSRASGGVVIITTKRGKEGKSQFDYDVQFGTNQLAKKVDLMNSDEFAQLVIDGRNNAYRDLWENTGRVWNDAMFSDPNATRITNVGSAGSVSIPTYLYDFPSQKAIPQTVNTDWQDELYRNAFYQKHTLSFSGGNAGLRYYLSGAYQNQEGIILNSGQVRYNLRSNIDGQINKKLHVGANISFTQNNNKETQEGRFDHGPILGALIYMPFFPAYNADGSLATNAAAAQSSAFGFQSIENPVALATRNQISRVGYRAKINANATYKILPELAFKVNLGTETYNEKYDFYWPTNLSSGANPPGSAQSKAAANSVAEQKTLLDRLAEFTLNYKKGIGKHNFDALAGYTAQKTTNDVLSVTAKGFQNDNITEITGKGADAAFFTLNGGPTGKSAFSLLSYFGRLNYNYGGKYFITGSYRTDGSSRFGSKNKYGSFPSIALGWNVSDEPFYTNLVGNGTTLKLRASYGLSGNYNIGNYSFLQTQASPTGVVFGNSSTVASATFPGGIADENLSWETTKQYNFGADVSFFNGRLSAIANYYLSYSYDLLYNQPISAIGGSTTSNTTVILTNLRNSEIRNRGIDLQLDGKLIKKDNFDLNLSGNISVNRNLVTKLPGNNTIIINGAERSYLTNITTQGQPVGMFYGFKVAGMVTADNISKVAPSAGSTNRLRVGDIYFEDTDGNGVVNDADKTVIGTPYAKFTYGFALSSRFKAFDLSASFNGSEGNQILDGQDYYLYNMEGSGNQYKDVVNRYRNSSQPGDGFVYRPSRAGTQSNSTRLSTFYLQDGSYLRCTNITLGYTLPSSLITKLGVSNVNLFGSVVNAFTITNYKGYNPEVDYNYTSGATNTTQPPNLSPGIDYGVYPLVRSFNVGLRASF